MPKPIKGQTKSVPECPKGYVWCPNSKKCIPENEQRSQGQGRGLGRGQGKGPMGQPTKEERVREANKLVDDVFDNPTEFKKANMMKEAEEMVDNILDGCSKVKEVENQLQNAPTDNPDEEADRVKDDVGGIDKVTPGGEDESVIEGATEMIEMFMMKEELNAYQKFVQAKLKASGYSTPAKMPPDKRKAFFSNLSKEWKAKKGK